MGQLPAVVLCCGANSLAVVRGCAAAGIECIAVAQDPNDVSLLSRIPSRKVIADHPSSERALLAALSKVELSRAVLIPTSDALVQFVSDNRLLLETKYALSVPTEQQVRMTMDKRFEYAAVRRLGVPLPRTITRWPARPEALLQTWGLPLIVKPRSFKHRRSLASKTLLLTTVEDLREFYRTHGGKLEDLIAQEVIPGPDDALWKCDCSFNNHHDIVGAFTFRKLGMSPPHYGVATHAISESNPDVVQLVQTIGRGIEYVGPANFEFKYDARDGQYKYIEMNPRLGLCNYFDTVAGVNNVAYAYQLALGRPVERQRHSQRDGLVFWDLYEDLYGRIKQSRPIRDIVMHYARYAFHRKVGAYFLAADPLPGLAMGWRAVMRTARSIVRKVDRKRKPPYVSNHLLAANEIVVMPASHPAAAPEAKMERSERSDTSRRRVHPVG